MISAANEAGDRNNPTNGVQIRLRASLMGQKDCAILPQLSARLGLRQGQDEMRILSAVRKRDVKLAQAASIWVQDLDSVCAELMVRVQGRQSGGELGAACVVYGAHVGEVAVRTDKH